MPVNLYKNSCCSLNEPNSTEIYLLHDQKTGRNKKGGFAVFQFNSSHSVVSRYGDVTWPKSDYFFWWMCRFFVGVCSLTDKSRLFLFPNSSLPFPPKLKLNKLKEIVSLYPSIFEMLIENPIGIISIILSTAFLIKFYANTCKVLHVCTDFFGSRSSIHVFVVHAASVIQRREIFYCRYLYHCDVSNNVRFHPVAL